MRNFGQRLGPGPLVIVLLAVAGCGGGVSGIGRDAGHGDDETDDGGVTPTTAGP